MHFFRPENTFIWWQPHLEYIQARQDWLFILYHVRVTAGLSGHLPAEVHHSANTGHKLRVHTWRESMRSAHKHVYTDGSIWSAAFAAMRPFTACIDLLKMYFCILLNQMHLYLQLLVCITPWCMRRHFRSRMHITLSMQLRNPKKGGKK